MEKISEEIANKLLASLFVNEEFEDYFIKRQTDKHNWIMINSDEVLKHWKEKGYIKQSREEELRDKLKEFEDCEYPVNYEHAYYQALELIEIIDNKDKQC